uniref:KIB1-4 beta-propeller domain-containing protein n=1 Tax=Oryza glumipatula TaxID=40148 RepID=A0A0E0ALT4_9ORYZ
MIGGGLHQQRWHRHSPLSLVSKHALLSPVNPTQLATMLEEKQLLKGNADHTKRHANSFRFGLADDRTVVIHNTSFLAVAKPGDKCWTAVDLSDHLRPIMSFAGRFYGVTTHQRCHHGGGGQPGEPDAAAGGGRRDLTLQHRFSRMLGSAHLVDNNGELLLVHRTLSGDKRLYQAYRVDLDGRKTVPVRGLGGRAVFIGHDCSLSVSPATFPPSLVTPSTRASAVGIELAGSTSKPMITWQMEPLNTHSMKTAKRIGNIL